MLSRFVLIRCLVSTDVDNDLDLFVGNENAPNQLFLNNGDGTFTDVARKAGVTGRSTRKP